MTNGQAPHESVANPPTTPPRRRSDLVVEYMDLAFPHVRPATGRRRSWLDRLVGRRAAPSQSAAASPPADYPQLQAQVQHLAQTVGELEKTVSRLAAAPPGGAFRDVRFGPRRPQRDEAHMAVLKEILDANIELRQQMHKTDGQAGGQTDDQPAPASAAA